MESDGEEVLAYRWSRFPENIADKRCCTTLLYCIAGSHNFSCIIISFSNNHLGQFYPRIVGSSFDFRVPTLLNFFATFYPSGTGRFISDLTVFSRIRYSTTIMGLSLSSLFSSLSSLVRWSKDQDVRILMLGLDSAGKVWEFTVL